MASLPRDRLRSWLTGLLAVALVVVAGLAVVLTRPQPLASARAESDGSRVILEPPADVPYLNLQQVAVYEESRARIRSAAGQAKGHAAPFLAPASSGPSTLVLPPAGHSYDLAEVAATVPSAFDVSRNHGLTLTVPLLIAPGATLVVDSATVPALYLSSGGGTPASIWALRSSLHLIGHVNRPLVVSSTVPGAGRPDVNRDDGRAFIETLGGDLTLTHADVGNLGFGTGETSGVSWMAYQATPATGGTTDSVLHDNFFGAYASGAKGLSITRSSFLDNSIYGFDPHTGSTGMVITDSVAARNGRHGFIISRNCSHNQFRDDEAYGNGGAGFMVDDGNRATGVPGPSSDNLLLRVWSHDNRWSGIVIEGGSHNVIDAARVEGNSYGIWVRGQARDSAIQNSRVSASSRVALRLDEATAGTRVTHTSLETTPVGVDLVHPSSVLMQNDRIVSASDTAVRITGQAAGLRSSGVVVAGTGARVLIINGSVLPTDSLPGIDDSGWVNGSVTSTVAGTDVKDAARAGHLLLVATVLTLPFLLAWPLRRRRARAHRSELLATEEWSIRAQ
jgi:hypothetical protein